MASEAHFKGAEEILYLSKGRIEVLSGDQKYIMHKDDSIKALRTWIGENMKVTEEELKTI